MEEYIRDVATIDKGSGISKDQLSEEGEPCILYGELYTKYKSEIISDIFSKTDIDTKKLTRSRANDVIIPCSGETAVDIATARCVPYDGILLGGDLSILRFKSHDGAFISYQLNGKRKYDIARVAQGVSVVHLYPEHLKGIKIFTPSLEEQQKIVHFLSKLDERISTQIGLIEDLKKLKSAIRKRLFVSKKYEPLENFAQNISSGKDKNREGMYPLYGSTGIIGTVNNPSFTNTLTLVARVGSIGTVQYVDEPCGVSDNTLIINAGKYNKFIFYFLCGYNFERITSGTTQPLITASSLKKIEVPNINNEERTRIVGIMEAIEKKIAVEMGIKDRYVQQREHLLQQMFI